MGLKLHIEELRKIESHSNLFFCNCFIDIGGRSRTLGDNLPIAIYNAENSERSRFFTSSELRQSSFTFE